MTANTEPAAAGSGSATTNVWCVRADHGEYTEHFIIGGYVAYGGLYWPNMSSCETLADVHDKLKPVETLQEKSKAGFRKYGEMMARFLWDIQAGDWVITPEKDRRRLRYGKVQPGNYWYAPDAPDGCPYTMRRKIVWEDKPLDRWSFSPSFQNTLKCNLTVFGIKHRSEFLTKICRAQ